MKLITAPSKDIFDSPCVFLAGGITNCGDWQQDMVNLLKDSNLTILNPRRIDFDIAKVDNTIEQINWECKTMWESDLVVFWFPQETVCPITLFELGLNLGRWKKVLVGVHPNYSRKLDLEVQVPLYNRNIKIANSIHELAEQILEYDFL